MLLDYDFREANMEDKTLQYLEFIHCKVNNKKSLSNVNKIIKNHQLYFTFETATKILRKEQSVATSYSTHLKQLLNTQYGGTCFSNHYILYNVLKNLNYNIKYIFLEPDHCALLLTINSQEYYIDTSFWAPLFEALPINESWKVPFNGILVEWIKNDNEFFLMRNGYIAKTWKGKFLDEQEFFDKWSFFGHKKTYFNANVILNKWFSESTFVMLHNYSMAIYKKNEDKTTNTLSASELEEVLIKHFKVSPELYMKALNSI